MRRFPVLVRSCLPDSARLDKLSTSLTATVKIIQIIHQSTAMATRLSTSMVSPACRSDETFCDAGITTPLEQHTLNGKQQLKKDGRLPSLPEEVIALTQALVRIDSSNPGLGSTGGPGETAIARYITSWLEERGIETHRIEPTAGRPSIVGIVRGSGGGKSLMFNGHTDTVTLLGYDGDALSAHVVDGKMYGRGTADMKSGLAASMIASTRGKEAQAQWGCDTGCSR